MNKQVIIKSAGPGKLTPYALKMLALDMLSRGKAFMFASVLLEKHRGSEFVVLHNLCQGIEVYLKGLLQLKDYRKYDKKKLKKLGHDLIILTEEVRNAYSIKNFTPAFIKELNEVNFFYKNHFLRYSHPSAIFIRPSTLPINLIVRKMLAVIKMTERSHPPGVKI